MALLKGVKLDTRTRSFVESITNELTSKDQYDSSLDIAIYLAAVQFTLLCKLSTELLGKNAEDLLIKSKSREGNDTTKKNPLIDDFNRTAEQLRKALRELGLTLDSAKAGIGDDPVDTLIDQVNNS